MKLIKIGNHSRMARHLKWDALNSFIRYIKIKYIISSYAFDSISVCHFNWLFVVVVEKNRQRSIFCVLIDVESTMLTEKNKIHSFISLIVFTSAFESFSICGFNRMDSTDTVRLKSRHCSYRYMVWAIKCVKIAILSQSNI